MARIVIVFNEHPTERIAYYHARKVADILERRYGHEVVRKPIPTKDTNLGLLMCEPEEGLARKLFERKNSDKIALEAAEKHGGQAFNFHSSACEGMGEAVQRTPEKFRVRHYKRVLKKMRNAELTIEGRERGFVVEVPGFYSPLPKKVSEKADKGFRAALKEFATGFLARVLGHGKSEDYIALQSHLNYIMNKNYRKNYTPLYRREQEKYLSPKISEKIAKKIHEMVSK